MKSDEIRAKFLKFFEDRGHRVVPSSPLIPQDDPTLLFANAGMNQFKDIFLGPEKRDYTRACSSQKCVRAGGKHNDLEQVGRTRRHHTFFEMLGNFSFGPLSAGEPDAPESRRGYFKREIVVWAWDLMTRDFGLPADRLWVTVFREDDEAAEFWRKDVGLAAARILRCDEKDNFWAMGETGPCGPCSELYYDLGPAGSDLGHEQCEFPCPQDCGRYMEIWNLVFMQYNRLPGGKLEPLPSPSVDTGLGLERMAAVLQGKISNFDTDLFSPLIEEAADMAGLAYGSEQEKDVSLRILADHARAAAFLITDGVMPSNEGRGYVLRKILRRAIRHGQRIGLEDAFLYKLAGSVCFQMKDVYPELAASKQHMASVVKAEEEGFTDTLRAAQYEYEKVHVRSQEMTALKDEFGKSTVVLPHSGGTGIRDVLISVRSLRERRQKYQPVDIDSEFTLKEMGGPSRRVKVPKGYRGTLLPEIAFRLYDTFGMPLDLIKEQAEEDGIWLDVEGFERELRQQRERARASRKGDWPDVSQKGDWQDAIIQLQKHETAKAAYLAAQTNQGTPPPLLDPVPMFVGYDQVETVDSIALILRSGGDETDSFSKGQDGEIILNRTPFYAEAGGQVGDTGVLLKVGTEQIVAEVTGTYSPMEKVVVHKVRTRAPISKNDRLVARVDSERRDHTRRNHTATHLLHAALRKTLGSHVKQAGSLVAPDRLRFDFSHYKRLEEEDLRDIEDIVNRDILSNLVVETKRMDLESAVGSGAMALFGEKYGEEVRVVSIGEVSKELCGGTHVRRTGDIGLFKLVSESSVAAGVRRIEALTGEGVLGHLRRSEESLERLAVALRAKPEDLVGAVERLRESEKKLRKELDSAKARSFSAQSGDLVRNARTVKGVQVVSARVREADRAAMRRLVDQLRPALPSGVIVLGSAVDEKVALVAAVSRDLSDRLDAGKIAKQVATIIGGRGGGRRDLAEAGGKRPEKLDESIEAVYGIVEGML